jgi:peptide/nickel transport system substrate-binding protein
MHIRRSSAAVALVVVTGLALAACASSGSSGAPPTGPGTTAAAAANPGATINIGSLYEPTNLSNVGGGGQGVTEALTGNVYEGLFRLADDGSVQPLLAKADTVSSDGLHYEFTLQDGVTFASGEPLTAADVVYSLQQVLSDSSQSARKSQLAVISDVTAKDDHTVDVTLKQRSISFLYNLSFVWIIKPGVDLTTTADGTGPYAFTGWTKGSTLTLERNEKYWGAKAKNAKVVYHYFTDASALSNALQAGDVDVITNLQSPDALTVFDKNPQYTVSDGSSTTKLLLAFNDKVAPFDNVDVRKAVYSAIDRAKLLSSIWGDKGQVIGSMVPPSDPWYEDLTNVNPYDPTLSKQLLAKAGLANGFTFTLDTPTYDPHPVVAEFLKSELAKVGITVQINSITADQWYTKVYKNHDFTATLQEHVNTRDVVWYGNPDFYWGYDNPQVTDWINQAEQAATAADQTALLKKANEQIAADAASAWLYLYPQIVVSAKAVSGYPVNGLNSQFFAYDIVKTA